MVISIEYFIAHCLFAENINRNRNSFGFVRFETKSRINIRSANPLPHSTIRIFETKSIKSKYTHIYSVRLCNRTKHKHKNANSKKKINKNNAKSIVQNPQKECSTCIFFYCELWRPFSRASRVRATFSMYKL